MRELIIQRIREIRKHNPGDFDKHDGRWAQLNVEGVHISEVAFSELANDQLVHIFEHIVRRYYTQR